MQLNTQKKKVKNFVLCTATQPALASYHGFDFSLKGLDGVREIMGDAAAVKL